MPVKEQNELDKAMAAIIRGRTKAFQAKNKRDMLQIKANIAYLCGHQNIEHKNGTLVPLAKTYETAVVANKILPAVTNDISVSTKSQPKFDIVPSGTDEDDKATAKTCQKILPYLQRINDKNLERKAVVLWYDLAGVGWRKVYWSPEDKITGYDEGGEPVFQGEVRLEHIPNNELIYDSRQTDHKTRKWIIHAKTITIGEVRSRFDSDIAFELSKKALYERPTTESFEAQVMGDFAIVSGNIAPSSKKPSGSDMLDDDKLIGYWEFWHIPDRNMPQGAYAVALGNDLDDLFVVVNEPYPREQYPHMELPFIPVAPLSLSGISSEAVSRISQARPLQRYLNEMLSLIKDNSSAMGNSVIITSKGANVDFKKVDNGPGNWIEVDGPYVSGVRREPGVPVAGSIFAFVEVIMRQIDEIFAFHEPSKGIMPEGGPRSAIGLQVLQDADNTQLSPIVNAMDEADERVIHQMLTLAVANYENRLIQIVGKDNSWVLEKISREELKGKINVIVRTGSSMPINKTMEQEKMVFAWQSGLLGNPQDPSIRIKVLQQMELGGFDQILQDSEKHRKMAQMEFIQAEKLALQMPPIPPDATEDQIKQVYSQFIYIPPINEFDDHYVHSVEHTNWLLDKYYEYISSQQQHLIILAQAMRDHNMMHQQTIQQMQMMAIQQQMMVKGTTPEQIELKKKDKPKGKTK